MTPSYFINFYLKLGFSNNSGAFGGFKTFFLETLGKMFFSASEGGKYKWSWKFKSWDILGHVSIPKLPPPFAGNERFLRAFPRLCFEQSDWTRPRKTWVRGQFSLYREWFDRLIYNTYPIPTETMILNRKVWLRKMPIGRIFGAQTTSAWTTVEIEVCSLDFVFWQE